MKKLVVFIALLLSAQTLLAQGVVFESGTWSEMIGKAKEQNKLIFVDFYTTWCAPCKVVTTTVFPDPKLGRLYNEKFVNYKIDAEKGEGVELAKKYGVSAFPTFLYINGDGEVVSRLVGGKTIKEFITEIDNVEVYAKYGGTNKMEEAYAAGRNDSEFLADYLQFSPEEEKSKVYNQYLMSLPDEVFFDSGKRFFDEITVLDLPLFHRIADGILKMDNEFKNDDSYVFFIRFASQYKLSGFIDQCITEKDRKQLDEILIIKQKLWNLPNSYDGDINLVPGRGLLFASDEFINLIYTHKNESVDKFKQAFSTYINREIVTTNADTVRSQFQKSLDQLPQEFRFMIVSEFGERNHFFAETISAMIDTYWKNSPSNKVTISDCAKWANYIFQINPYNSKSAILTSTHLVRLNKKKEAIEILKDCIKCSKELKEDMDVKKLEDQIRYIENNKI